MSIKNTGLTYEKLVQSIFDNMLNENSVNTIKVEQNYIVQGKTLKHQIDVYWEFEVAGITYKTIVQAKDWNSSVKQEQLLTFAQVLADIPGQPRGIVISKKGFQSGAKKFAATNNIIIYELREPTDKDWNGRIRDIEIKIIAMIPHIENLVLQLDQDWIENEHISQSQLEIISGLHPTNTPFFDENDSVKTTLDEIFKDYIQKKSDNQLVKILHYFSEPIFFKPTNDCKLKVKGLSFNLFFTEYHDKVNIYGSDIVKFILVDILGGQTKRIGQDLKLLGEKNNSITNQK